MDETITIYDFGWKMTINLRELAESAGVKKKMVANYGVISNYDYKVTSVPMERARKLLKLIQTHGREEDFEKCDKYFAENAKLDKLWKEFRCYGTTL